eukprot:270795_1
MGNCCTVPSHKETTVNEFSAHPYSNAPVKRKQSKKSAATEAAREQRARSAEARLKAGQKAIERQKDANRKGPGTGNSTGSTAKMRMIAELEKADQRQAEMDQIAQTRAAEGKSLM